MTDVNQIEDDIEAAAFREFAQLADQGLPVPSDPAEPTGVSESDASGSDPAEETAAGGQAPAAAAQPEDVWADASEAQRAAWEELQTRLKKAEHADMSNRGQVAALQRRLNDLTREMTELKSQPPAAPSAPAPGETDSDQQVDLKQFSEDFPEVFAAMRALQKQEVAALRQQFDREVQAVKSQFEGFKVPLEAVQAEREHTFRQEQLRALGDAHPDFASIQQSDDFWGWVDTQPDGIKALAASVSAAENIRLLNLYKLDKGMLRAAPSTPPAAPPRRPRNPDDAAALPRRGAPRMEGVPEDEDAAFRYWAQQADQQRL